MVRLSNSLIFLATLAVGFASPFIRGNDDGQVLQDMECIKDRITSLQNNLDHFSPTVDDVNVSYFTY